MRRPKPNAQTVLARFTAKYVTTPNGCWEWLGSKSPKGYGHFHDGQKDVRAHRWAYEHFIGPVPDGLVIDHLCRNHACVNPAHLEPVTNKENLTRGIRPNALKTHWKRGHPFTEAKTILSPGGSRSCRTC